MPAQDRDGEFIRAFFRENEKGEEDASAEPSVPCFLISLATSCKI